MAAAWASHPGDAGGGLASPPAHRAGFRPRWRDPRLGLGIALVAASVLLGAWFTSASDERVWVVQANHDLAAGTVVAAGDLVVVPASPEAAGAYAGSVPDALVGRTITRPIGGGELIPTSALGGPRAATRLVTIPVEPMHGPVGLHHGDRVDVYVSPRDAGAVSDGAASSRRVLADAVVADSIADTGLATGESAVVLEIPSDAAPAVVAASRSGVIDLVRVPVEAP